MISIELDRKDNYAHDMKILCNDKVISSTMPTMLEIEQLEIQLHNLAQQLFNYRLYKLGAKDDI